MVNYETVKDTFEKEGCKLITTEDDFKFLEYQLQINSIFYKKIFNNKD